jgi:hypothetical protein
LQLSLVPQVGSEVRFGFCFSIAGHGRSPGRVPVGLRTLAKIEPWQKPRLKLFRAWFHAMIVRRGAVFA